MRRNKQHTFLELRHPDRDRRAGRPSPTPRLYDPLQPLITWPPRWSHTPEMVEVWEQAGDLATAP